MEDTAFMYLGEMVKYGPTSQIFKNPDKDLTERYVSGICGQIFWYPLYI
jgi:phosphate transport system ATP-binding protein